MSEFIRVSCDGLPRKVKQSTYGLARHLVDDLEVLGLMPLEPSERGDSLFARHVSV
jgi:hypothetical protein